SEHGTDRPGDKDQGDEEAVEVGADRQADLEVNCLDRQQEDRGEESSDQPGKRPARMRPGVFRGWWIGYLRQTRGFRLHVHQRALSGSGLARSESSGPPRPPPSAPPASSPLPRLPSLSSSRQPRAIV